MAGDTGPLGNILVKNRSPPLYSLLPLWAGYIKEGQTIINLTLEGKY